MADARETHYEDDQLEISRAVVGPGDNNVFVLRCRQTGEAVLIDAANEAPRLLDMARRLGVRFVLQTHGHHDHVGAIPTVRAAGYDVGVHPDDAAMLPAYDFLVDDGDVFDVGRLRVRAVHTPGHTPGSTCYLVDGSPVLLAGDTLFPGGPGATRKPLGDFPTIITSIRERLFTLPPDTVVMPGHGKDTTIGTELPHLQEWIARGW